MKIALFATAFLGVFLLLNFYISRRLIAHLDIKESYKKAFRWFLVINYLGIIGYMLARYYPSLDNTLYFLLSVPIGVVFLLFCTTLIYDLSRLMLRFAPLSTKRRRFFKRSLDISSLVAATALSAKALYNARYVELERVSIEIKDLAQEYTIIQLSDIHIGGLIDAEFIRGIVERVNKRAPDLVVITGDLVDIELASAMKALRELQKLDSKYGTFFVVGNHEYFHGVAQIIKTLNDIGIRVLENENVYIGAQGSGFHLAGVYDVIGYRVNSYIPDISKALKGIQNAPTILLAHQPRYIHEVPHTVDLMLSGHTHGGQLYPFRALVKLQQPYVSGLHQHTQDMQIYVNKGTGFWGPPMRLGASSEITEITLKPRQV
jgi:uncharacterized protein